MCGIFGILSKEDSLTPAQLQYMTGCLFKLSESRGKEASGFAIRTERAIYIYKAPTSASQLIRSPRYKQIFHEAFKDSNLSTDTDKIKTQLALIGHSRLVTTGTQSLNDNNQPVLKDGAIVIHNGIIVNHESLWEHFPSIKRQFEVDTEVIPGIIQNFRNEGDSVVRAVQKTFNHIEGTASLAVLFNNSKNVLLATNTGSLYVCTNEDENMYIFASEEYILEMFTKKRLPRRLLGQHKTFQVKAWQGCLINLSDLSLNEFSFDEGMAYDIPEKAGDDSSELEIFDLSWQNAAPESITRRENEEIDYAELTDTFDKHSQIINKLKRCTRCVLLETMPFIEFDERGVCNYCRDYVSSVVRGEDALENSIAGYRGNNGEPDCIVAFSGGRDSSYVLHYVKKVLKMNPIAYSYDWGMITDLARRNQARLCGKLGIEHILISADINRKRRYIRGNVEAWLKKPDLGTVPLFMAGDKQYFYYANKLKNQTRVKLIMMGMNSFEKTDFKTGFCGVRPLEHTLSRKRHYTLSHIDKIRLAAYYGKQYLLNPSYLNASIFDTLFAFFSYYLIPHEFLNIYQYIQWDEKKIISTLIDEYDWEVAEDSGSTWRIGDGTAAFYNYIYFTAAGFTENDTFRSNQIREGIINRGEALELVQEENKPRYDSIKWYCDTIGINFKDTLKRINSMPKLY